MLTYTVLSYPKRIWEYQRLNREEQVEKDFKSLDIVKQFPDGIL